MTHHLDQLAATGMRFTNCYATTNCTTTRAELLTGQYPFRNGWTELANPGHECFNPAQFSIPRMFKSMGYKTCISGKWQLCLHELKPDNIANSGFDEHFVYAWAHKGQLLNRYWSPVIWTNSELQSEPYAGKYGPDLYNEYLLKFITRHHKQPFFAYYPMCLPHSPFYMPPSEANENTTFRQNSNFTHLIKYIDYLVGKVVTHLENLGIREKTIIILTADNGCTDSIYSRLNGRQVQGGKSSLRELGVRVPFIVNWKGTTPEGAVEPMLTDFTDILPTMAEAATANIPPNTQLDGRSIFPVFRRNPIASRDWIYSQYAHKWVIRNRNWKLFWNGKLFDLENDPYEDFPIMPISDSSRSSAARVELQGYYDDLVN